MTSHDFDRTILRETIHRRWPMPDRPWVMTQTWRDLLFAHWRVDPERLRPTVPRAFALDLFDGHAWVSVVPFCMTNVAPRGVPALPWISAFPEVNLRTYVRVADRPGVYFYSLDARNPIAVRLARTLFNLPYHPASMTVDRRRETIAYTSHRRSWSGSPAVLHIDYQPVSAPLEPRRGSLEYFLSERYCSYATHRSGRPYRLDIHHPPWRLQEATATVTTNTLAEAAGLSPLTGEPLLHFSSRQDVVAWAPVALDSP